jgi:hypothetical protein
VARTARHVSAGWLLVAGGLPRTLVQPLRCWRFPVRRLIAAFDRPGVGTTLESCGADYEVGYRWQRALRVGSFASRRRAGCPSRDDPIARFRATTQGTKLYSAKPSAKPQPANARDDASDAIGRILAADREQRAASEPDASRWLFVCDPRSFVVHRRDSDRRSQPMQFAGRRASGSARRDPCGCSVR